MPNFAYFGGSSSSLDNATSLNNFNEWARAETTQGRKVELVVSPGTYYFNHLGCIGFLLGIKHLRIIGYGAVFQNTFRVKDQGGNLDAEATWGRQALPTRILEPGKEIETTKIGDQFVDLLSISDASEFSPGDWIIIGSLDIWPFPVIYGFPPNLDYFEYTQITSIVGRRIFVYPFIKFPHRSDFPDRGDYGKSRIAKMDSKDELYPWDISHIYEGIEIRDSYNTETPYSSYMGMMGRRIKFVNCSIPGIVPTFVQSLELIGCDVRGEGEPDKLVESMVCERTNFPGLYFQSSSINRASFRDCVFKSYFYPGTIKHCYLENCEIGLLQEGALYGLNRRTTLINCTVHAMQGDWFGPPAVQSLQVNDGTATYSSGRFSILKHGARADSWSVIPGIMLFFFSNTGFTGDVGTGIVTRISEDSTHRHIDTTLLYDSLPSWATGAIGIQRANEFRAINCNGCDQIRLASEADRRGKYPWEYRRLFFAGRMMTRNGLFIGMTGELVRLRINVINPLSAIDARLIFSDYAARKIGTMHDPKTMEFSIGLTNSGKRDFTQIELIGKKPGDSIKLNGIEQITLPNDRWMNGALYWAINGVNLDDYLDHQLPILECEFEFETGIFRKSLPISADILGNPIIGINGSIP